MVSQSLSMARLEAPFNIVEDMLTSLNAGMKGAETGATMPAFWGGGNYEEAVRFQELL